MSYPPVGYVVVRHWLKHDDYYSMERFYHDYDTAKKYCDEMNKNGTETFYYEPCEIDIYD